MVDRYEDGAKTVIQPFRTETMGVIVIVAWEKNGRQSF